MSGDPNQDPQGPDQVLAPIRPTLVAKLGISPVLFAFLSLGIVFILYQIVGGILALLIFGVEPKAESVSGMRLATALGEIVLILLPTLLLVRGITRSAGDFLRVRMPRLQACLVPIIGIFSLQQMLQVYLVLQDRIPVPEIIRPQLQQFKDLIDQLYKQLAGAHTLPELLWVIVVVALIPAIAEEFLFRGLVQRTFQKVVGPMTAAAISGILFAAYHLNPFSLVPLVVLGIYLGFVAWRADSIWASAAAHFYNNVFACFALYFQIQDDYVVTGNATDMSAGGLLATFLFFGIIFIISTYYFLKITRRPAESPPPPQSGTAIE